MFLHVCDDCGNTINLSNRCNAELPAFANRRVRFGYMSIANLDIHGRGIQKVTKSNVSPGKWGNGWRSQHAVRTLIREQYPRFHNTVILYDQVDSEFEAEDSFWSMEDMIVICPNCFKVDSLECYDTPKDKMINWTGLINIPHMEKPKHV